MTETGDRLAPVSYLFGAPADETTGARRAPVSAAQSARAHAGGARNADADEAPATWNDSWGDDVAGELATPDDADVERISLKALSRRSLSRRELERVLRDAGVDDEGIERECARLTRVGLLDDAALAQSLVGTLQERKGLGRTAIAAELARRLLAPAAIEYALELVDTGEELARAHELAQKRAAQLGGLDRDAAVRRLSGYLARRGYSGSTVRAAVEHALPLRAASGTVRFR